MFSPTQGSLARLRQLVTPPDCRDQEQAQTARILLVLAWLCVVLTPFCLVAMLLLAAPGQVARPLLIGALLEAVWVLVLFLARRGSIRPASYLVVATLWLVLTLQAYGAGSIHAAAYIGYFTVAFLAGTLLGGEAVFFVTGISILAGLGLVLLEPTARLVQAQNRPSPLVYWLAVATAMLMAAVLQYYNHWRARRSLRLAHGELAERTRVEQALRESEARYRLIAENSADTIWVMDPLCDHFTYVSPAVTKLRGYTPEEVMAQPASAALTTESAQMVSELLQANLSNFLAGENGTRFFVNELDQPCKDGAIVHTEVTTTYTFDEQGAVRIIGVSRDITERKRAELALQASQLRIKIALEGAEAATWEWNVLTGETVFDERWAGIVGYSRAELEPISIQTWHDLCHPEDLKIADEALAHYFAGTTERYQCEVRMKHKDGSWVWVADSGRVMEWNAKCQPVRMSGMHIDITARKRAEMALRESEARFRKVFDASPLPIAVSRLGDGRYTDVNHALEELAGYTAAELIGHQPAAVEFWADIEHRNQLFAELRARGSVRDFEFQLCGRDGAVHDMLISAELVELGGEPRALTIAQDITARKRAESALKMAEANLRRQLATKQVAAEIAQRFVTVATQDRAAIIEDALARLGQQLDVDRCCLLTYDGAGDQITYSHGWTAAGVPPAAVFGKSFRGADFPSEVSGLRQGRIANLPRLADFADDFPVLSVWQAEGVRSALILPLLGKQGLLGMVGLTMIRQERTWEEWEVNLLQIVGRILADGLEHMEWQVESAALNLALAQRVEELKQAEEQASRRQELLEQVIRLGKAVTAITDLEQCLRQVYESVRHGLGFDRTGLFLYDAVGQQIQGVWGTSQTGEMESNASVNLSMHKWDNWEKTLNSPAGVSVLDDFQATYCPPADSEMYGVKQHVTVAAWAGNAPVALIAVDNLLTGRAIKEIEIEALQLFAGYVGLAIENARLQTGLEQRVRERTAQVQDLYENAPAGYHSLDDQGVIVAINQTELNWLGYTREELLGQPFFKLLTANTHAFFWENYGWFKTDGRLRDLEAEFVRKDGTLLPVLINASAVYDAQGKYLLNRATVLDNTARKRAETALRASNLQLAATNAALEKASQAKNDFLANMSHELRTPLNGILSMAEILLDEYHGPLNDLQRRLVSTIDSSGQHLLSLINDILDLAKIEVGRLEIHPESVGVNDLCRASLAFVKEPAAKKRLQLSFVPDPNAATLRADARRVKQMLVNLLGNAIKFTPAPGRVTLQVKADLDQDRIEFSVTDTGIGIAQEDLLRLFTPFSQVDSSLTRQHEGTGLGLALVKELAELHGGGVHVTSTVGEGSCFTVFLPWQHHPVAQAALAAAAEPGNTARPAVPAAPPGERTLLLAEDNESNILAMRVYFEGRGYKLIYARTGREAIEQAEASNPDLILMDMQMPVMNGLDATRMLRANPRFAATPIIAVTALAMAGDRERCLAAGATAYASKPVSLNELATLIRRLLEEKPGA